MAQSAEQRIEELESEVAFLKQELGMVRSIERQRALQDAFQLTGKAAELLLVLYDRPRLLSRDAILAAVWGSENEIESRILEVFICKLRKALGFSAIETIWGSGYRLTPEGAQLVKEQLDNLPS